MACRSTGSTKNVYKTLQGYGLPGQKAMRGKAAEDMDAHEKEHTGEQQGPEVTPTMKQSQMPMAQLLAFEQVRDILCLSRTYNHCLCWPQL